MTGLEKILNKIGNESDIRCKEITEAAEKECSSILAEADEKGRTIIANAEAQAKAESEKIRAMAQSGAAQKSRQALLAAKVEIINNAINKVLESIMGLSRDEYYSLVISQAKKNALKGNCTAFLGAEDLEGVPSDFGTKLTAALEEAGAVCSLSDKCCNIKSGILLSYGDIEVNCSFESIIDSMSDELKAKISETIF